MTKIDFLLLAFLITVGCLLRIPDPAQGLLSDEQVWLERSFDLAEQISAAQYPDFHAVYNVEHSRFVRAEGEGYPFNISIKSHHPGYATAMIFAGVHSLFDLGVDVASLIQLRLVQSAAILLIAVAGYVALRGRGASTVVASLWALFIVSEPFILGESRTIKQDALLTAFVFTGLLATSNTVRMAREERVRRSVIWCMVAGLAFGLAICTKAVAVVFLLPAGIYVLLSRPIGLHRWHQLLIAGSVAALSAFLVSPNIWASPIMGAAKMFYVALSSSQTSGHESVLNNALYTINAFTHFSLFFPFILVAYAFAYRRSQQADKAFWLAAGVLALGILLFASVKAARYAIPFVVISTFATAIAVSSLKETSQRTLAALLPIVLALHLWNFASFYPYHMVYTWEFLDLSMDTRNNRLSADILAPDIGVYLEQERIPKVKAVTMSTLHYYYSGEVENVYAVSSPALALVSRKYYSKISPSCVPIKSFTFHGYEVYRLLRVDGDKCQVG